MYINNTPFRITGENLLSGWRDWKGRSSDRQVE
jgi:hypothetical protein